jgi:Uma2 family endonuclease
MAPVGLLMPGCEPVQPDYVVVLASRAAIIRDRRIMGVPDLVVEVLSPGSAAYDERVKLHAYAFAGVPEYAIVDPRSRTLSHYRLDAPGRYSAPQLFNASDTVTFDCLPTLSVPVGELFAGAPDTTL